MYSVPISEMKRKIQFLVETVAVSSLITVEEAEASDAIKEEVAELSVEAIDGEEEGAKEETAAESPSVALTAFELEEVELVIERKDLELERNGRLK